MKMARIFCQNSSIKCLANLLSTTTKCTSRIQLLLSHQAPAMVTKFDAIKFRSISLTSCKTNEGGLNYSVEAQDMKCFRCGEVGHLARNCQNADLRPCFRCGQPGHIAAECPDQELQERRNPLRCYACGKTGHIAKHCPSGMEKVICHRCGVYGHMASACPEPEDRVCFVCGKVGHLAANCTESTIPKGTV